MDYRQLGRTGVRVSPLCLGAMNFGGVTDETESIATIHAALDAGINFVDTANVYSRGASESVVGKALKGRRDEVVLATKVHGAMGEGPNDNGNSRRHVKMQCEASLRRLQTDWIDLYQLHRPDDQTPIEETLEALDELVREGKVNYVGVSTFPAWQTMEAIGHAERWRLRSRPVCEQPPYNLLDRRVERDVVPLALKHGLGIIPWSPLASGVLSGKYSGGTIPEGSRLANYGVGILPLALAWLMAQPGVTSPIIGPRDRQQLAANLAAVEVKVDDGVRAAIDEVSRPGRAILAL